MLVHKFEQSGIGSPPYRVIGFYAFPSKSLAEHNPSAYSAEMLAAPDGAGLCSHCGTSLINNYIVMSSDKKRSILGCDCVTKIGDTELISEVKAHKRKISRDKARAKREAKREEENRLHEIELENQRKKNGGLSDFELYEQNRINHLSAIEVMAKPLFDAISDGKRGFCDDIAHGLLQGYLPYGRGFTITVDILTKHGVNNAEQALCDLKLFAESK